MRLASITVLSVAGLFLMPGISLAFTSRPSEQTPTSTAPSNPAFNADKTPDAATAGSRKAAAPAVGGATVKTEPKADSAIKGGQ